MSRTSALALWVSVPRARLAVLVLALGDVDITQGLHRPPTRTDGDRTVAVGRP
ncbi:hypothetical protein [Streptomyces sp. OE57]|uniref:hypothetical protein n=1 Tax=Streptomyces lacaronensis TaxID=3379885 RepID=UPI0039B7298C